MTPVRSSALKFGAFSAVALLLLLVLVNTMVPGVKGDTHRFHAVFSDVSGLRTGDAVRVAGVRVGTVTGIQVVEKGAEVTFVVRDDQPVLENTRMVMRYQNLLGQRYLALVQPDRRADELEPGSTIPLSRTSPGIDLTALLNGFRPLFQTLKPETVNALATSIVKVLEGEAGSVERLLQQTAEITSYLADRDEIISRVLDNLTPVLENLADQAPRISSTIQQLRRLMKGLARDRQEIGRSIEQVSRLVDSTADLFTDLREPLAEAVRRFRETARMLAANREEFVRALDSFGTTFAALGRAGSYESALNVYVCSLYVKVGDIELNPAGNDGPFSKACR